MERVLRFLLASSTMIAASAVPPLAAHAQWTAGGIRIAPASYTYVHAELAPDNAGGVFVGFVGAEGYIRAYVTRLGGDGVRAPSWPASGLLLPVPFGHAGQLAVAADGAGGVFVVAGVDYVGPLVVHHVTGRGESVPGWPVVGIQEYGADPTLGPEGTQGIYGQAYPTLFPDGAGGVFVSWLRVTRAYDYAAIVRIEQSGIVSPGRRRQPTGVDMSLSTVGACPDGAGGAFLSYTSLDDVGTVNVVARHVFAAGEFDVPWPASGHSIFRRPEGSPYPRGNVLVPDGSGGVYAVWQGGIDSTERTRIQHLSRDGAPFPGWPSGGIAVSPGASRAGSVIWFLSHSSRRCSAVEDGAGGIYVSWTDLSAATAEDPSDVRVQRLLADGSIAPGWPPDGMRVASSGAQDQGVLAADGTGGVWITWQDTRNGEPDIFAQHFGAKGQAPAGAPVDGVTLCAMAGVQERPSVCAIGPDRAVVAWTDRRDTPAAIYAAAVGGDGIVATRVSRAFAEPTPEGGVRVTWNLVGRAPDLTVVRRTVDTPWSRVEDRAASADSRVEFVDDYALPGTRYGYALRPAGVGDAVHGEVWFDVPQDARLALGAAWPNPATGEFSIRYSLPGPGPVRVELLDLAGRVLERRTGENGAGSHIASFSGGRRLSAGVYVVRIVHDGRSTTTRVALTK